MSALARFTAVERMLNECAPGSTWRRTTHGRMIRYNGRVYPTFPKFEEIEIGHIRKMVKHLLIDRECAHRHIPTA